MTGRLMLKQERQERILDILDASGRVVVTELQEALGVSGYTVRRDLDELAEARPVATRSRRRARPFDRPAQL